jgi:hypothetical protein
MDNAQNCDSYILQFRTNSSALLNAEKAVRKEDRERDQIEEINKHMQGATPKERRREEETSRVRFYTSVFSLSFARITTPFNLHIYITSRNVGPFTQRTLCCLLEAREHLHHVTLCVYPRYGMNLVAELPAAQHLPGMYFTEVQNSYLSQGEDCCDFNCDPSRTPLRPSLTSLKMSNKNLVLFGTDRTLYKNSSKMTLKCNRTEDHEEE